LVITELATIISWLTMYLGNASQTGRPRQISLGFFKQGGQPLKSMLA